MAVENLFAIAGTVFLVELKVSVTMKFLSCTQSPVLMFGVARSRQRHTGITPVSSLTFIFLNCTSSCVARTFLVAIASTCWL